MSELVVAADEGIHRFPQGLESWQESVFYDWIDRGGRVAGHCRIGIHPVEGRVWFWLFVMDETGWIGVEQARLPLADFDTEKWRYEGPGLMFERVVSQPLERNELRVNAVGRRLSGPDAGALVPLQVRLNFVAATAPQAMAGRDEHDAAGHVHQALRFEQPMCVRGEICVGVRVQQLEGWGERDHSWGSRYWDLMDWTFLVIHGDALRVQCTEVAFAGMQFVLGFAHTEATHVIEEAKLELSCRSELEASCGGTVRIPLGGGRWWEGRVAPVGVVAIDIDHVYPPSDALLSEGATYRRALVRLEPLDGSEPLLGWLEWCRRPAHMCGD